MLQSTNYQSTTLSLIGTIPTDETCFTLHTFGTLRLGRQGSISWSTTWGCFRYTCCNFIDIFRGHNIFMNLSLGGKRLKLGHRPSIWVSVTLWLNLYFVHSMRNWNSSSIFCTWQWLSRSFLFRNICKWFILLLWDTFPRITQNSKINV